MATNIYGGSAVYVALPIFVLKKFFYRVLHSVRKED